MGCIVYNVRNLERLGLAGSEALVLEPRYGPLLSAARGDLVIYYTARTTRRGGEYCAAARVGGIFPGPSGSAHLVAEVSSFARFASAVPACGAHGYYERSLTGSNWRSMVQRTVRQLREEEALAILGDAGAPMPGARAGGFGEAGAPAYIGPQGTERVERLRRWIAVRHQARIAYGWRCCLTDTGQRSRSGATELECCHIRPLEERGPDNIRNVLLLGKSIHWAFDHHLISLEDDFRILTSDLLEEKYRRMLHADGYARMPADPALQPALEHIRWHRKQFYRSAA